MVEGAPAADVPSGHHYEAERMTTRSILSLLGCFFLRLPRFGYWERPYALLLCHFVVRRCCHCLRPPYSFWEALLLQTRRCRYYSRRTTNPRHSLLWEAKGALWPSTQTLSPLPESVLLEGC
jgi:hypothetical protein